MKKVKVLDIQFDVCTLSEALNRILDLLKNRRDEGAKQIVTPNPEMLLEAQKNPEFKNILNKAWMSIPDGIGILWASSFQTNLRGRGKAMRLLKAFFSLLALIFYPKSARKIFPQRVSGVDLMSAICSESRENGLGIFLLGAAPGVAEKTKHILEKKFPGIKITGTFAGSPSPTDETHIKNLIQTSKPDILFVAFGAPAQEIWIHKHLPELKSVKIAMGVGGAFDFLAGIKRRAPKLMRILGLEWFFRLIQEPSRIKRIWNAVIKFPCKIINQ